MDWVFVLYELLTINLIRMTVEDFKKLAEKHLFVLEELTINKEGVKEMQIFGFDALYEQLRIHDVVGQSEQLVNFLLHLNGKELINNHDFDYEKEAKKYLKKIN